MIDNHVHLEEKRENTLQQDPLIVYWPSSGYFDIINGGKEQWNTDLTYLKTKFMDADMMIDLLDMIMDNISTWLLTSRPDYWQLL